VVQKKKKRGGKVFSRFEKEFPGRALEVKSRFEAAGGAGLTNVSTAGNGHDKPRHGEKKNSARHEKKTVPVPLGYVVVFQEGGRKTLWE